MIVVADTSPINYLVQLRLESLLGALYGDVIIPPAVRKELSHVGTPEIVRRWIAEPPAWLTVVPVAKVDATLPGHLGEGETEAISLAIELRTGMLLDDQRARKTAELRGVETAGTIAVIVQGAVQGLVNLEDALAGLRTLGFRITHEVEARAMATYLRMIAP